jgi:hypothetical protein
VIGDASNCEGLGVAAQLRESVRLIPARLTAADPAYWARLPGWRPALRRQVLGDVRVGERLVELPLQRRAYLGQRRIADDLLDRRLNSGPSTADPTFDVSAFARRSG